MYACETGLVHSVKLLVDKGAKTSLKDAEGATAREIATLAGHDNCVAALPVNAYLVRTAMHQRTFLEPHELGVFSI